ncbi:universal stress protein [Geodermatophilus sabuli]|uniref:Universal stress protein n=1 Tax=Geodermatophilus sabuli TaxID=1564158 RepID=A0A7K3VYB2_9ACTN|nr:universal stress protein [Geodermatophilus sabuli]
MSVSTTTPTPAPATARPADDTPPAGAVVVGTDGSECALQAVRWATEEAARRGAPLRIVHATRHLPRSGVAGASPPELPRARGITAHAYTVARHTDASVPTSTQGVPGDPVTALVRAAQDADLLVLGIATTGAADEMVLASVAQRVAARSPRPVVVVPRRRPGPGGSRPHVVVLGLGDRGDDEPVARFAAEQARRAGRPLLVVHSRPDAGSDWTADAGAWRERHPDLQLSHQTLPGVTGGRVLAAACPTPLLTLSAGHGGLLYRPLDGLHRWLLRHCTSPMAFVPPVFRRTGLEPRSEIYAVG